jgi:hypothetical protein
MIYMIIITTIRSQIILKAGCTTKIPVKHYYDWAYDKNTCPVRDKMLVEKLFHRLYSVPSGTLCEMEKIHISYPTARKKCDISIFYQHFMPDGTKIEQDYTTFDCAVLRKFFPAGNFVVHPSKRIRFIG